MKKAIILNKTFAMNSKADSFFGKARKWKGEMTALREIVLECGMNEDFKWMHPCYTYLGNNVVLIHAFKEYCAFLFFKGVLLKDKNKILIQQTENVQDRRQARFTSIEQIQKQKTVIKAYIREAIVLEKSGQKVEYKKTADFKVPEEFATILSKNNRLRTAFETLTPGRQRGYLLYFGAAKQAKTRESRIESHLPRILAGKGLDD
jgi:uncharacterized protein YdeI (YjbR/CyaY-like superfamily)